MGWQARIKRARRYLTAINTAGAQQPNDTPPKRDLEVIRHVVYKANGKAASRALAAAGVGSLRAAGFGGVVAQRKTRAVKRAQVKVRQHRSRGRGA